MTIKGDHTGKDVNSEGRGGFYIGVDANGCGIWKKLPYLPKVIEGSICIEELRYVPEWHNPGYCLHCGANILNDDYTAFRDFCDKICQQQYNGTEVMKVFLSTKRMRLL